MVINILMTRVLAILIKLFFKFSKFFYVPSLWIFMSQLNYLMLEIGTLDSLLRQ